MTRRFWTQASAAPNGDCWEVLLDGKPMRLPSGASLATPYSMLARAIGAEWQAAGEKPGGVFGPADVPLTGLAGSAQDCVGARQAATVDLLKTYAEADLLCYRVDAPRAHAARQHAAWQPWLDWAKRRYGAALGTTTAVAHLAQPGDSVAALREALAGLPPPHIAAMAVAIPALGSCVLGLALAERMIGAEEAADSALLDEMYQQERWGSDAEAAVRLAGIRTDIALAARFIALTESVGGEPAETVRVAG